MSEPPLAWPDLLPELRRARDDPVGARHTTRRSVGAPDATEQVEEHVHGLETGSLAAARVRPAVVTALAAILEVPESLLEPAGG